MSSWLAIIIVCDWIRASSENASVLIDYFIALSMDNHA